MDLFLAMRILFFRSFQIKSNIINNIDFFFAGRDGEQGKRGPSGDKGTRGRPGLKGEQGVDAFDGFNGFDGTFLGFSKCLLRNFTLIAQNKFKVSHDTLKLHVCLA